MQRQHISALTSFRFFFAVLMLCCTGALGLEKEKVVPEPLSAETIAVAQATIRKALGDPDSAKFGEIIGGRNSKGLLFVCGWVNAKDRFGGYTGMLPFNGVVLERRAGSPSRKPVEFVPTGLGDSDNERVLMSCKDKGLFR